MLPATANVLDSTCVLQNLKLDLLSDEYFWGAMSTPQRLQDPVGARQIDLFGANTYTSVLASAGPEEQSSSFPSKANLTDHNDSTATEHSQNLSVQNIDQSGIDKFEQNTFNFARPRVATSSLNSDQTTSQGIGSYGSKRKHTLTIDNDSVKNSDPISQLIIGFVQNCNIKDVPNWDVLITMLRGMIPTLDILNRKKLIMKSYVRRLAVDSQVPIAFLNERSLYEWSARYACLEHVRQVIDEESAFERRSLLKFANIAANLRSRVCGANKRQLLLDTIHSIPGTKSGKGTSMGTGMVKPMAARAMLLHFFTEFEPVSKPHRSPGSRRSEVYDRYHELTDELPWKKPRRRRRMDNYVAKSQTEHVDTTTKEIQTYLKNCSTF